MDGQKRSGLRCLSGLRGFCGCFDCFFLHHETGSPLESIVTTLNPPLSAKDRAKHSKTIFHVYRGMVDTDFGWSFVLTLCRQQSEVTTAVTHHKITGMWSRLWFRAAHSLV